MATLVKPNFGAGSWRGLQRMLRVRPHNKNAGDEKPPRRARTRFGK
jgi:hypothetical protein